MAKESKSIKFTNACIEIDEQTEEMTITETSKDEIRVYNLSTLLKEYIGVEGISFQLGKTVEIKPDMD